MKKIELYLETDFKNFASVWDEAKPFKVLTVDDDMEIWGQAISIGDKVYSACSKQKNKYKMSEVKYFKVDETEICDENEITCPICGYEVSDSWEIRGNSGEEDCSCCGSTFEWTRNAIITYSSEVKGVAPLLKLD